MSKFCGAELRKERRKWKLINKIYHSLLEFAGFMVGETITNMLRRQKARLGKAWWVMVITSLVAGNGFLAWLIWHILQQGIVIK